MIMYCFKPKVGYLSKSHFNEPLEGNTHIKQKFTWNSANCSFNFFFSASKTKFGSEAGFASLTSDEELVSPFSDFCDASVVLVSRRQTLFRTLHQFKSYMTTSNSSTFRCFLLTSPTLFYPDNRRILLHNHSHNTITSAPSSDLQLLILHCLHSIQLHYLT